jgi:hypothetical protein
MSAQSVVSQSASKHGTRVRTSTRVRTTVPNGTHTKWYATNGIRDEYMCTVGTCVLRTYVLLHAYHGIAIHGIQ